MMGSRLHRLPRHSPVPPPPAPGRYQHPRNPSVREHSIVCTLPVYRIESAEASEYWDDDSNQSRVEEWTHRYEMMDFAMESWEEGCDYAINNWTDLDQHEFMEIEK